MSILVFSVLLFIVSCIAGILGALTGLGGGIVVIPVLVLFFHVNIHYAMGASLISVIATSSGSSASYLREGYTNLRIGMFLESVTVIGALVGAMMIAYVSTTFLTIVLSLVLFISAYLTIKRSEHHENYQTSHPWAMILKLYGTHPVKSEKIPYHVQHVPLGLSVMGIAGMLSGLLGIGSGTLKVLAMDQILRLPYKVATTTSNFMIGITGAVSAGIYFSHGYIHPVIAFPVMLGVVAGSFAGARLLMQLNTRLLRTIFSIAICFVGLQMIYNALKGTI